MVIGDALVSTDEQSGRIESFGQTSLGRSRQVALDERSFSGALAPVGSKVSSQRHHRLHTARTSYRGALIAAVCIQIAHASPAVGDDTGLMSKFSAPHEVSARAIDIAVLKAPNEIEGFLPRNDDL